MSIVVAPELIAIQRNHSWPNLRAMLSRNTDDLIEFLSEQFPHHVMMPTSAQRKEQVHWLNDQFGVSAIGVSKWTHGSWVSVSNLSWQNAFMFLHPEQAVEFRMNW